MDTLIDGKAFVVERSALLKGRVNPGPGAPFPRLKELHETGIGFLVFDNSRLQQPPNILLL
jgi:hypothetical protein